MIGGGLPGGLQLDWGGGLPEKKSGPSRKTGGLQFFGGGLPEQRGEPSRRPTSSKATLLLYSNCLRNTVQRFSRNVFFGNYQRIPLFEASISYYCTASNVEPVPQPHSNPYYIERNYSFTMSTASACLHTLAESALISPKRFHLSPCLCVVTRFIGEKSGYYNSSQQRFGVCGNSNPQL